MFDIFLGNFFSCVRQLRANVITKACYYSGISKQNCLCCLKENGVFNLCTYKTLNCLRIKYFFIFHAKNSFMKLKDPDCVVTSIFFYQFNTLFLYKAYNKCIIIAELMLKFSLGLVAEVSSYLFYGLGFLSAFVSLGTQNFFFPKTLFRKISSQTRNINFSSARNQKPHRNMQLVEHKEILTDNKQKEKYDVV